MSPFLTFQSITESSHNNMENRDNERTAKVFGNPMPCRLIICGTVEKGRVRASG